MKILHTSDWHLGHTLYNYERTEEQQAMLQQMVQLVIEHQPDIFLLCGDVYHTSQPSAAVQTLFTDTLMQLHTACPTMDIIVTAGNHDSATKHEIFRTPWQALHVHMIGTLDREHPETHILELSGKGYLIAVPYIHERNLPDDFFAQLLAQVEQRNNHSLPVVLTAHTTVRGCDFTGHEHATEYVVGGIDSLDLSTLGIGYDYLALGHIHHAQFVRGGQHRVRYSGTPLPITFDETFEHSVSLVEIESHGAIPQVTTIPIINLHPLVTLPISGTVTWKEARKLLQEFPSQLAAYLRLKVEVPDFLPLEASHEAQQLVADKACRFCYIQVSRQQSSTITQAHTIDVQTFQAQAPIDIVQRYADDLGITLDSTLLTLFREAASQAE